MTVDEIMALVDEYARTLTLHEQYGEPYEYASNKRSILRAAVEQLDQDGKDAFNLSVECRARAVRAEAERDALRGLLVEARAEVEFWTPDECHVSEGELHYLNLWFALRDRIDALLKEKN